MVTENHPADEGSSESPIMTAKMEIEYGKILADLTELHRNCSNLDTCPSCNMLRADLTKVVANPHTLKALAASTEKLTSDAQTPTLLVKVIQFQKDKDDLLQQLKKAETLAQQRKEKLDSLDVEAVTAKITQLREIETALEERNYALRAEMSKAWKMEFITSHHGGKIESLLQRDDIQEPSPHPNLDGISSLAIRSDASSTMRKRNATDQYEQPQAKRFKMSVDIAKTARRAEGWPEKPGQAPWSHHTQHLALQRMIAVGAIDPILTSLDATGLVSLSDEGLKQFAWAQKHKQLKLRKDFDELSERFAGKLQELLQYRGLDKAGHLSIKKLSELAHHSRPSQPGVDEILSQLHQVLISVQPLRQKLHNTLERISNGGTGDADFISCVEELKQSVVPALFSVYTWEPETLSHTEPGLARAIRCDSVLGWRRRIYNALASLASKYKDLEALKAELELEWRPAHLLSDKELCEISVCPEHTEAEPSA